MREREREREREMGKMFLPSLVLAYIQGRSEEILFTSVALSRFFFFFLQSITVARTESDQRA